MVVDFNGGGFDRVDFAETTAAASVIDTIDPTAVFISTRNISEGEAGVAYTISLDKLPQTDAMVTVSMDGTDCTVNISAGEINSSVNIPNSSGANTITGMVEVLKTALHSNSSEVSHIAAAALMKLNHQHEDDISHCFSVHCAGLRGSGSPPAGYGYS